MSKRAEILARWEARLKEWARLKVSVDGVDIAKEVLDDLHGLTEAEDDAVLSLSDAAVESGYSTDHLSKLIRAGNIPNAGRKGSPKIRRKDLPIRPTRIASGGNIAYNAVADARLLKVRR